jgi:hypothetical protein
MKNAEKLGFEIVDMQPVFLKHYRKYGQRFEFPNDGHWNSLGHELFTDAIAKSKALSKVLASYSMKVRSEGEM